MNMKSNPPKAPAEQVVKDIRRATRRHYSAEDKVRIVMSGLRGEESIAELCRKEGIAQGLYYSWSKEFLDAGKKRLAGDTARLDRQLCFALYSTSLAMTKLYRPLLEPLGLTYPQYLVMLALWEQDELSVSDLGERLQIDSGTLSPLLKRLDAAELLTRRRDPADERRVLVTLTLAGRRLKARAESIPQRLTCAAACDLDELADLTARLQTLRRQLSAAPISED